MQLNDVVYFVKDTKTNAELQYSLRTVEKNFPCNSVWFYGGCPKGLKPDHHVPVDQDRENKWQNVNHMLRMACKNEKITESFWLFNDDFFILKKVKKMPAWFNSTLDYRIMDIENRYGQRPTPYTKQLRKCAELLQAKGLGTLNYAVHVPMLINRKKALEVLDAFPDCPMFRSLYGNYWEIGGVNRRDVKLTMIWQEPADNQSFLSTEDIAFNEGLAGRFVLKRFPEKSRFERH